MKVTCETVLKELTPYKDQLFLLSEKPFDIRKKKITDLGSNPKYTT